MKVVTEEYGNSPMARKWGVRRYPVVFVDDVLVARPKDFGFSGEEDTSKGLYVPWREPASQQRFKADLQRMVDMRLRGEQVAGLNVDEVRTEAAATAEGPSTMPEVALTTIAGAALTADSLKGKVVVGEMWATWCPPCRSTLAWLNELKGKYGDRLEVIAVAVDSPEPEVRKMTGDLKATYHVVQGTPEIISRFGDVAAVPKLFVFGPDGTRIETFYGAPPDLHERIAAAVDKATERPTGRGAGGG